MAEILERSDSNLKPSEVKAAFERSRHIDALLDEERENRQNEIQLLTLGSGGSGKSTFIKQLKILYEGDYTHEERLTFKPSIYKTIRRTLKKLVAAQRELGQAFENAKLEEFAEKVSNNNENNGHYNNNDVFPLDTTLLETFWETKVVQKCYSQRHALHIDDSSKHFLDNISRISNPDYVPSTEDILLLRNKTSGIHERQIAVSGYTYRVIDVGGQKNHRKKWIHLFEGVTSVVFFASLSCYNETLEEDNTMNALQDSLDLFQEITHDHYLEETEFILFLNKYDLFVEKLQTHDLHSYFSDYEGGADPDEALNYIREQFMTRKPENKNVYVHVTTATDTDLMKTVLNDVFDILVDVNLRKIASF